MVTYRQGAIWLMSAESPGPDREADSGFHVTIVSGLFVVVVVSTGVLALLLSRIEIIRRGTHAITGPQRTV